MDERYKRQGFLGPDSERILAECLVALVGLGGGGSHVAQQLAHLGIRNFLLIDPDRIEESNLNRLVGGTSKDVERKAPKTSIAKRLIRGVNPAACVQTVSRKWHECHELLRGPDIVFGSLDTYRDRYELEVSTRRYKIPYIDMGMDVCELAGEFSVSGQVILSMPGRPCMRCLGFLRDELMAREAENYGAAGSRPQVVWANGLLASAAVALFTQLFTPWHKGHSASAYLEYDANSQTMAESSRLAHALQKPCTHFENSRDVGDPFWIPRRVQTRSQPYS